MKYIDKNGKEYPITIKEDGFYTEKGRLNPYSLMSGGRITNAQKKDSTKAWAKSKWHTLTP